MLISARLQVAGVTFCFAGILWTAIRAPNTGTVPANHTRAYRTFRRLAARALAFQRRCLSSVGRGVDGERSRYGERYSSRLDVKRFGFARSVAAAKGRPPYDPRDLLKLACAP